MTTHEYQRNPGIQHINRHAAPVELPPLTGTRYTDTVPDTLDLAERAAAAIHGMTAMTDPQANYELYWMAAFGAQPPLMYHDFSDVVECKFTGPVSLLRTICGAQENRHVDWHRLTTLRQMQGQDGGLYDTTIGRPWAKDFGEGAPLYAAQQNDFYCFVIVPGRLVEAALVHWKLTGDDSWRELAERAVVWADRMLIDRGDYGYYGGTGIIGPDQGQQAGPLPERSANHVGAWTGVGALSYHRLAGFAPAVALAHKLARFFVHHSGIVEPDGDFGITHQTNPGQPDEWWMRHFHVNTIVRTLILEAGLASGDEELIRFGRLGYDFAKQHGEPLMGFFPECTETSAGFLATTEICEVADMVYLALRQTLSGLADCWDDIDCWVRNMFTEGQLLDTSWAEDFSREHGKPVEKKHACRERVAECVRGVWAGWIAPNQLQGHRFYTVMNCCTGNAALQLYRVWREMARFDAPTGRLTVHLLLNKAMAEADIYSQVPNRGRVEVKVKAAAVKEVAIRLPNWVTTDQAAIRVNGQPAPAASHGRYLRVPARAGQTITLDFPIAERNETFQLVGRDWPVVIRGNTIVDIRPTGDWGPIHQHPDYMHPTGQWGPIHRHPEYRTPEPRMVKRERYVHPLAVEI